MSNDEMPRLRRRRGDVFVERLRQTRGGAPPFLD